MPQMWRIRFQWKDRQDPPASQESAFVASAEDAIPQLTAALEDIAANSLGDSITMNATMLGELRGNPGAPG